MKGAPSWSGRMLGGLVLLVGCLLLGVAQAQTASAHAQILNSDPADGANLGVSPPKLTLLMSEAVELRYTKITITDGQGRETPLTGLLIGTAPTGAAGGTSAGAAAGAENGESPVAVTAALPAMPPDLYRIAWSTVSSDDLHTTSGVIVFGVQRAVATRAGAAPDPLPDPAEVALRWAGLIGMGTASGAALLALLLRRRRPGPTLALPDDALPQLTARLLTLAAIGAVVTAVADVAMLLLQAHATGEGWFGPAAHLLTGSYGRRWAGRELAAVGTAIVTLRAVKRLSGRVQPPVLVGSGVLVLSLGYAFAVALTGHAGAGAAQHPVGVTIEAVHVSTAMAWVGALIAALLVLWRPMADRSGSNPVTDRIVLAELRRAVLSRFGLIAGFCLATMTITGLLLAGARVASVDATLSSTYGRLLLVKLALVGLALSAGATTALTVHPHLLPASLRHLTGGMRLRGLLALEATAAVAALLAAAALGSAQPAIGPAWAAAPRPLPLVSGTAADLVETVQVSPNLPGRNFVTLDVYDSRRPAPAPIGSVQLTVTRPGRPASTEVAVGQGAGRWLLPTDTFTAAGSWTLDVQVSRPGYPVSSQRYDWVVADPNAPPPGNSLSSAPLAPLLDRIAEGLIAMLVIGLILLTIRGRRRVISAPPAAASPAQAEPSNAAATAATSASPSPVPGS
jgi:copper transport protein